MTPRLPTFQHDLPLAFIRQFRPVTASTHEHGVARYLFDEYGLTYYRAMSAIPIQPNAIWSVVVGVHADRHPELVLGQRHDAAGHVVTSRAAESSSITHWLLPPRLSLRQRIRQSTVDCLIEELRAATTTVPAEVIALLESRSIDETWLAAPRAVRAKRAVA